MDSRTSVYSIRPREDSRSGRAPEGRQSRRWPTGAIRAWARHVFKVPRVARLRSGVQLCKRPVAPPRLWFPAMSASAGVLLLCGGNAVAQPFATRVIEYAPAPGQLVNNPAFNNPARALGAPIGGGTYAPNNSKLVTLGGFGGSITLAFDSPVLDQPMNKRNVHGLDFIVYGNPFWVGGNPNRRFLEPATVEISVDVNHNGLADDPWYLFPGSHLPPMGQRSTQTWDTTTADGTYPPSNPAWLPVGASGVWTTSAFQLPGSLFPSGPILVNPNPPDELFHGYADCTPTLVLGDTMGDNLVHDPNKTPAQFYTRPDDPFAVGVTPGSGGGDAFDISWAVDPATGQPANLSSFDFIRITTSPNYVHNLFGEISAEIAGVARVIIPPRSDWDDNGQITPADVAAFVNDWFDDLVNGTTTADFDGDGVTAPADVAAFVAAWFAGV